MDAVYSSNAHALAQRMNIASQNVILALSWSVDTLDSAAATIKPKTRHHVLAKHRTKANMRQVKLRNSKIAV